jgi:hypothetical protein
VNGTKELVSDSELRELERAWEAEKSQAALARLIEAKRRAGERLAPALLAQQTFPGFPLKTEHALDVVWFVDAQGVMKPPLGKSWEYRGWLPPRRHAREIAIPEHRAWGFELHSTLVDEAVRVIRDLKPTGVFTIVPLTQADALYDAYATFTWLRRLELDANVTAARLSRLAALPELLTLDFSRTGWASQEEFHFDDVAALSNLVDLKLPEYADSYDETPADFDALRALVHLEELDLLGWELEPHEVETLVALPSLKRLENARVDDGGRREDLRRALPRCSLSFV